MRLDERGKQCPLPVIEAKKALENAAFGTVIEVVVDNEIAVQNLKKMANHKGVEAVSQKVGDGEFIVKIKASSGDGGAREGELEENQAKKAEMVMGNETGEVEEGVGRIGDEERGAGTAGQQMDCQADARDKGMVVVLPSDQMGQGDESLGRLLMKGFVYALAQQDRLPGTILLFNGGAKLSCEGSDSLEDLKELEAQGVEVLTCGTCLNHYGLSERLAVGAVTNMYEIAERMTGAKKLVRP